MPDEQQMRAALDEVIDPELGLGIEALGLVYAVRYDATSRCASVTHTLTTPACPLGEYFEPAIRERLLGLEGIDQVEITLTFEPLWEPRMMSDEALFALGMYA